MKIGINTVLAAGLGVALVQLPAHAQDKKPDKAPAAPSQAAASFKDDKEKASYGIGMYFGNMIKRNSLEVDVNTVISAMKDVLDGKTMKLTDQEGQQAIMAYQQQQRTKQADQNKKEGEAFLAANKKKPGVKTKTITLADGKTAEMQYKVLTEGTGATPGSNDVVTVNYRGTFIDGKEFDNSTKHGSQPSKFPVNRVVRGWTEALEMMKVGSKWELYLPADLAYGSNGRPGIEPGATLIFEMELVSTETPPPPPPPQPLTSDIIKVPSAEEMKKGAKIEVLKPEEAAKLAKENSDKKTEKK